jgi:hypothetical protein
MRPGASHARLHFVGDQQHPVLFGQRTEPLMNCAGGTT